MQTLRTLLVLVSITTTACGSPGSEEDELPAGLTKEAICRVWNDGHVENEATPWKPGADSCDPGTLSEVAVEDTLRRIDMFRALSGLPPVTEDRAQRRQDQACAVLMNANQDLSHEPPRSWSCWTQAGRDGAASSNLALGPSTPAEAVDLLMTDAGVPSVGHRRWLLGFHLGKVGIGFAGNSTCIGVFDDSGSAEREWTAYPPPGPAPIAMVRDRNGPVPWTFHVADGIEGAEVTMRRMPEGDDVEITSWIIEPGYMIPDAIAWQPPRVRVGESYRVTITRPDHDPVEYDVELVDCSGADSP